MLHYYLTLAWRRCRQNLPMVALLVLTMAIGIASCMTALTIFGALSGNPLPGISPHLYVATMDARESRGDRDNNDPAESDKPDSYLDLNDARALVDAHRARQQVALAQSYEHVATPDGKSSDQVLGLMAYGPVLDLFGVPLRSGRNWTVVEQAAHAPVVVIDADLSDKLFGTQNAVGRSVAMGTRSFRVIGVSAPWKPHTQFFDLPRNSGNVLGQGEQFFMPAEAALEGGVGPLTSGECGKDAAVVSFQSADVGKCRWLETWLALDTPAAVAAYQQFLAGYADVQHAAGRFVHPPKARLYGSQAWMAANRVVPDDVRLNAMLAGAFLLLCMVNVAGLLAARFLRRQADVAIRRALGASRRHVFAQHLVETGVLGLAGGVLALPLTWLGLWIVRMQPVAYAEAASFSTSAFIGLLLLSVVVGLLVGILPAWRICRLPPAMQIKQA
jgi:putative ABC transport system permease protein